MTFDCPKFSGRWYVRQHQYAHGGLAVEIWDDEGPYARLSIWVNASPDLPADEFVLNHDIDRHLYAWMVHASGRFVATGHHVGYGFVSSPVVRLIDPEDI